MKPQLECMKPLQECTFVKKGRIEGFDCFVPQFLRVLSSSSSVCVVPVPSIECRNEMLDYTVLGSWLRLVRATVLYLGGLLEEFLLSFPSMTRVGPTGITVRHTQQRKAPFKGILSSVSIASLSSEAGMQLLFSKDCPATLLPCPSRFPSTPSPIPLLMSCS